MSKENLLIAVPRLWSDIKGELEPPSSGGGASSSGSLADQDQVSKEEVKKVAKWLQHSVTKFAASAAVAEGPNDEALKSMAPELVKAFTAAAGTLLSIRKGAGPTLVKELWEVGSSLAKSLEALGGAVGSKNMAVLAGQVLDRVKHFDRVSCGNRSAARRRLLTSLTQIRDAAKELEKVISSQKEKEKEDADADEGDGDSADDFDDFDGEELEPEELVVMEGVALTVSALEDVLKEGSSACAASASAASSSAAVLGVSELEGIVSSASAAQKAIDGIVAHGLGGMDVKACTECLGELRTASKDFACCAGFAVQAQQKLSEAIDQVEAALKLVPTD